jgi:hypothetical protein
MPSSLPRSAVRGEIRPVLEIGIAHRPIARMCPQAMVDMPDAVHVEGIDLHFFIRPSPVFRWCFSLFLTIPAKRPKSIVNLDSHYESIANSGIFYLYKFYEFYND